MADLQSIQAKINQERLDREEFAKHCKQINDDYNRRIADLEKQKEELVRKTGKNICYNCKQVVSYYNEHEYDYSMHSVWRCPNPLKTSKVVLE